MSKSKGTSLGEVVSNSLSKKIREESSNDGGIVIVDDDLIIDQEKVNGA